MTHAILQMGLALAGALAGIGLTVILAQLGLVWVSRAKKEATAVAAAGVDDDVRVRYEGNQWPSADSNTQISVPSAPNRTRPHRHM